MRRGIAWALVAGALATAYVGSGPAFASATACTSPQTYTGLACSVSDSVVRCALGALTAGRSVTVSLIGLVLANKGLASSTSQVATTTHDLDPTNDSASATVKLGNGNGNGN